MTLLLSLSVQDSTQIWNTGQEQPITFQEWLESWLKKPVKDALWQHMEEKASGLYQGLYIFTTRKSSDSTLSSAPAEPVRYVYWLYREVLLKLPQRGSQNKPNQPFPIELFFTAVGSSWHGGPVHHGSGCLGGGCRLCGVGPVVSWRL